jgi:hypothetical protein
MKDSSSSSLVILVVLVCLLGGGGTLYFLKVRTSPSDDGSLYGATTTLISEAPASEEWKEIGRLTEEEHTIILEGIPVGNVPSECKLRAQVIDAKGAMTFSEEFGGGWRVEVVSVKKSSHTEAGPGLLGLHCKRFINGEDIATQYYRVLKGRLVLVRLEDSDGRWIANPEDHRIGPKIPPRSDEAWEESLKSADPGEVLWALSAVRGKQVGELTSSSNPWIVEASKARMEK